MFRKARFTRKAHLLSIFDPIEAKFAISANDWPCPDFQRASEDPCTLWANFEYAILQPNPQVLQFWQPTFAH